MANLTVTIDAELLRRARIRALQQGESVNSLVRDYLVSYAEGDRTDDALGELLALSRSATSGSGSDGRRWTREQLHDR